MRKEIEFLAKIDTSEFDKAVETLQRKVREAYRPAENVGAQRQTAGRMENMGMGGILSKPSMDAYNRSVQSTRRDLDQIIQKEAAGQEKLVKFITRREEKLKSLRELQKAGNKDAEEELRIKEKISRVEENLYRQREGYKQRDQVLNQTMDARQKMSRKGLGGIVDSYREGGMSGLGQKLGGAAGIAGIAGSLGAGMMMAGNGVENLSGYQMRLEGARGSAISNTVGTDLSAVAGNRSPFESAWMNERRSAAGIAKAAEDQKRIADRLKGGGGILAGAGAGALMGSALGPIGTVAGGLIGGGLAYMNSNDRTRLSINPFAQKEYSSVLAGERGKDFRSTLESLKDQDPAKKQLMEGFEQNIQRDVGAQRSFGLNNDQFRGQNGFLARQAGAGFTQDQAIGMGTNILQAGGSARMATSAMGNQMNRMGYTNSAGILGSISGGIQSTEAGKSAAISAMAEAFKVGLNNSEFSEENRRFTQAAAGIIARTGATGTGDQDRITQALGQFLGEKTNMGVQSAQSAYERSQERGSQLSGRRGALRLQSALKDKDLSKIPMDQLSEILGMNPEDMNANSDIVQYGAKKAELKVPDFLKRLEQGRKDSRYLAPGNKERIQGFDSTIQDYLDKNHLNGGDLDMLQKSGQLPENVRDAMAQKKLIQNSEEQGKLNLEMLLLPY